MITTKIKVKDLTTNYKVQLEDGSWHQIVEISNGIYRNGKLLTYDNGKWSNVLNSDIIEAVFCEQNKEEYVL